MTKKATDEMSDLVTALRQTMSDLSHMGADEIERLRSNLSAALEHAEGETARLRRERDEARAVVETYDERFASQHDEHRAEVERLTRERDEARATLEASRCDCRAERDISAALRAEVERLRDRLHIIAGCNCDVLGATDTACCDKETSAMCRTCIARAALAEGEGGEHE